MLNRTHFRIQIFPSKEMPWTYRQKGGNYLDPGSSELNLHRKDVHDPLHGAKMDWKHLIGLWLFRNSTEGDLK